ncbi:MAG: S8 family serine peptidase [Pseudomonadota bacterium]|nr:S8 family serine peptidase [Pseudomonadota bacterium]
MSNTGQTGGTAGIDLNVTRVWDDYTGAGVAVGVYDDGLDYAHGDLDDNYDATRHLLIGGVTYDARPANTGSYTRGGDTHGTAVAGLIAAENDGSGSVGVAFAVKLTGVAVLASSGAPDMVEAMKQQHLFDVVNHSWGFTTPFAANVLSADAFWQGLFGGISGAAANGRGGLGTIIVQAAGNSRQEGFETSYDNFTNSRFVIAVGAVDHKGQVTNYSTAGPSLLVSAPSSGSGVGITTTDLAGTAGDTPTDYQSAFGGTSAAAPMVTGVVALMLEANPALGWRDVQEILAYSASHVGSAIGAAPGGFEWSAWAFNKATNWNGGGLHFSNDYGFGLIDAHAAVRLAETWEAQGTSATEQVASVAITVRQAIPDNKPAGVVFNLNLATDLRIDHVELVVNIGHTARGDLKITLTSPDGTHSVVLDRPLNGSDMGDNVVFTLASNAFWGESSLGTWTVKVSDEEAYYTGTVNSLQLKVYGDTLTPDDTYVYTAEFAQFGGVGSRGLLSDTLGFDIINAAAVTSDLILDLMPGGTSTIAGKTVTLAADAQVENGYGGDGNDSLTGNAAANKLTGGRGNDKLDGGLGSDALFGGPGDDRVVYDPKDVRVEGGEGTDTLVLLAAADVDITAPGDQSSGDDAYVTGFEHVDASALEANLGLIGDDSDNHLVGGAGDDRIEGRGGNDRIEGAGGNDSLDGGVGGDTMSGGDGDDIYYVDEAGDVALELADAGRDSVHSAISYTLTAQFERLTLTGPLAASATGNDLSNEIVGNAAANILDGALGADMLSGGPGNDLYLLDHEGDQVVELDGEGSDTVESSTDRILAGNVENLTLTGTAAAGTGNELANILNGNAAANLLDGGAGADTLIGHAGNDTYVVDAVGDVVRELAGAGTDTVRTSVSFSLAGEGIENLILTGTAPVNGTGNALANSITGNSGDNVLNGGTGADTLTGGAGNDLYIVDHSSDRVVEAVGGGMDTVQSSVSYSLANKDVERLVLTGTLSINGTGNALANAITGNGRANVLSGGVGADKLTGGGGADTFLFNTSLGVREVDSILDFSVPDDTIRLDRTIFSAITVDGTLNAAAFHTGTAAQTTAHRIIYDPASGSIFYDKDGTGAAAPMLFATVAPGLPLTNADFHVVA